MQIDLEKREVFTLILQSNLLGSICILNLLPMNSVLESKLTNDYHSYFQEQEILSGTLHKWPTQDARRNLCPVSTSFYLVPVLRTSFENCARIQTQVQASVVHSVVNHVTVCYLSSKTRSVMALLELKLKQTEQMRYKNPVLVFKLP